LAIIRSCAELVEEDPGVDRADYLRRIRHTAQQALDLVRNVLDAAAIDSRQMTPRIEPVQVNELVQQVVAFYQVVADRKHIRLVLELAAAMPPIDADGELLSRALGNLLSNAIKFTAASGTVRVSTAGSDSTVSVAVTDDGPGISEADQTVLFQKYRRT